MKIWKLVAGILSMVAAVIVFKQSSLLSVLESFAGSDDGASGAGMLMAIFLLSGGIVSVAVRKAKKNGGNITLIIIFGLAALIGFVGASDFSDLSVWGSWALINAVLALIAIFVSKKKKKDEAVVEQ